MMGPAHAQSKPFWLEPDRLGVSMTDMQPQRKLRLNRRALLGFTLIELLIGMVILGVILLAAASLLQGNQKLTGETQTRSNALGDARGAISRITETISQAAYIYPENTVITVGGLAGMGTTNEVKTGPDAIAVLISDGNVPATYKGVIYYLADRADPSFAPDLPQLPADRIAQLVLVEAQTTTNMAWAPKSSPLSNWGVDATEGVLVDGVDGDNTLTKLMDSVQFAPTSGYDPGPLISSVGYSVGIRVATSGETLADSGTTVLRGLTNARNVPRR
jgi:prepilin-type N-terminal cleavage/methylation domain-containing protein